ncbi:MAG: acyl-CoA dehydratase activase [Candidatus Latescibacter sp.]|nr:acyl-CoA dehydratase activase [Candidatus Latescibacter sp.]
MAVGIGIDIGSVSIKVAVIGGKEDEPAIRELAARPEYFLLDSSAASCESITAVSRYKRFKGQPLDALEELLVPILEIIRDASYRITVTGSGGKLAGARYGVPVINEFTAIVEAVNHFHPQTRTVFEMGGETSKFILLGYNENIGKLVIIDYGTNGDCAAGTGAFMDQQASRLKFRIEDVGDIVAGAEKAAQIAGRCSVFAKSDMIHAQQRGYQPDEVLKGLSNAVSRNFKSVISRSKKVVPPVLFIGGVALNSGMRRSIKEVFELGDDDIVVPETMCWLGALGCAILAQGVSPVEIARIGGKLSYEFPSMDKLSLKDVRLLRENITPFNFPDGAERIPVYLGVDIGSVSTNLAVIDTRGNVIKEIYVPTKARPIEVVGEGLREIEREIGDRIEIKGVGTTGSGRELIGILIGADTINDEITAHKTGALLISRTMLGKEVDTIFEIGGQDSKYISIEDGIVVDFTMNDACAAGTGSFLEEQAEDLGVSIKGEFAELALSSGSPLRLGERCTVFMGRDVNSYMQRGASKEDIIAGLAYSVVYNYLNRVVRGRKIGGTIFFQGGTAYNDSVAAAFAQVTGKEIIVPPFNGVIGAIGEALLAKRKIESTGDPSTFKGFDLSKINYALKEFTCKGCSNFCAIQEFTVDGEKTYWGDKCSDRYRKRKKVSKSPVIDDLYKIRDELLLKTFRENGQSGPVIGIPMTMYTYDQLPFYNVFLSECGFRTVLSDTTNTSIANMGIESVVAEPCHPIIVAHGHVKALFDRGVDYVWLPNIINSETEVMERESYVCVWGSTLPFVAEHSPVFRSHRNRILKPTLHFRDGEKIIRKELAQAVEKFGIPRERSNRAVDMAYEAQSEFRKSLHEEGRKAVEAVKKAGEKAIILVGRAYNVFDRAINLSVAAKLSGIYGINVIPMDFLDVQGIKIDHINKNMFWNYGKKILQTASKLSDEPNFDIIYITNFKCGPDSFIKQYVRDALGRPFLVLQFDGHSNDAGMMTRCEAYLDSKGFLCAWEVKQ